MFYYINFACINIVPVYSMQKYGITIKLLKTGLTDEDYRTKYLHLIQRHLTTYQDIFYLEMYQEHDKHGILHLHGILECPKKFFRHNLLERGYNICIKPITNEFGWRMYMTNWLKNQEFLMSEIRDAEVPLAPSPRQVSTLSRTEKLEDLETINDKLRTWSHLI